VVVKAYKPGSERGAVYVEMAISALAFFLLCFVTLDVLRLSYQMANAEFIVNRAVRDAVIDQTQAGATRLSTVQTIVTNKASRYGVTLDPATQIKVCSVSSGSTCTYGSANQSAGTGRQLVAIGIRYDFRFLFWLLSHEINAEAIGRNEPF